jgi:hypothetical protein
MTFKEKIIELNEAGRQIPLAVQRVLTEEGELAASHMRSQFRAFPLARGNEQLNRRSGNLLTHIRSSVTVDATDRKTLTVGVLDADPELEAYAATQIYGGTPSGNMAFPVGPALNPDGTPKYKSVFDAQRDFRTFINATHPDVIMGVPLSAGKRSAGFQAFIGRAFPATQATPLFIRRKQVNIKARDFVFKYIPDMVARITERLQDEIRQVFL